MTVLCPCGRDYVPTSVDGEIQILCDVCTEAHHRGRPDLAPSWARRPLELVRSRTRSVPRIDHRKGA